MMNKKLAIDRVQSMDLSRLADIFRTSLHDSHISYDMRPDGLIIFDSLLSGQDFHQLSIDFKINNCKNSQINREKPQYQYEINAFKYEIPFSLEGKALNCYPTSGLLLTA